VPRPLTPTEHQGDGAIRRQTPTAARLLPESGPVQRGDRGPYRQPQMPGAGDDVVMHARHVRGELRSQHIREARSRIGFVDDQWSPGATRSHVAGHGDVSAESDDGISADSAQIICRLPHSSNDMQWESGSSNIRPPRQRRSVDSGDFVSTSGHQGRFQASRTAEESNGDVRVCSHESICGIQCRLDMPSSAPGCEDYVHRRARQRRRSAWAVLRRRSARRAPGSRLAKAISIPMAVSVGINEDPP